MAEDILLTLISCIFDHDISQRRLRAHSKLLFSPLALPLKFDWEYVCIPRQRGEGEASPLADWSGVTGVMEATKNGRFGRRVKAVFLLE
jgi:hypothetical protein